MRRVLQTLMPSVCPVCDEPGAAPCAPCWSRLRPAPPGAPPAGLDRCRSLLAYDGAGRDLVTRLKYRNARGALPWLAGGMAGLVRAVAAELGVGVVTWAPTSADRRHRRGFDQAELLARAIAVSLGLPCRRLLHRAPGPPQTGRSRSERWQGPTFLPLLRTSPRGVLLVDDLLTTGATLSAAATALRSAGEPTIVGVTAARTPLKAQRPHADP